ncbi:MAG: VWA domain-containing protein [Candidatus Poribacteria bacterium]|nr:VWA domain-containing protein [Candidatus Poribacteria bacterium]
MAYSNVPIGTANPGCFVILLDQSASMNEDWGDGTTKADGAARAVNRVLEELVLACQSGEDVKDRCCVSVVGYGGIGGRVDCVVNGMISDIVSAMIEVKKVKKRMPDGAGGFIECEVEMPIWVEACAENGTPMHKAFDMAADVIQNWCEERPNGFPPSVINVTDGMASEPALTTEAARRVMTLGTTDGKALVYNLHIGNIGGEIILPNDNSAFLGDRPAEFLFSISSMLPDALRDEALAEGIPAEPDTRCFAYNAREVWMIKLLQFGSLQPLARGQTPTPLPA